MGKSKNRASAVRKIDPVTDAVVEIIPVSGTEAETVLESTSAVVPQTAGRAGVNPIHTAGHTIESLSSTYKTKSGVIRYLASQGFATKHIAVFMGIRYQHVRNVLTTQLKKPVSAVAVTLSGSGAPAPEGDQPDEESNLTE